MEGHPVPPCELGQNVTMTVKRLLLSRTKFNDSRLRQIDDSIPSSLREYMEEQNMNSKTKNSWKKAVFSTKCDE